MPHNEYISYLFSVTYKIGFWGTENPKRPILGLAESFASLLCEAHMRAGTLRTGPPEARLKRPGTWVGRRECPTRANRGKSFEIDFLPHLEIQVVRCWVIACREHHCIRSRLEPGCLEVEDVPTRRTERRVETDDSVVEGCEVPGRGQPPTTDASSRSPSAATRWGATPTATCWCGADPCERLPAGRNCAAVPVPLDLCRILGDAADQAALRAGA